MAFALSSGYCIFDLFGAHSSQRASIGFSHQGLPRWQGQHRLESHQEHCKICFPILGDLKHPDLTPQVKSLNKSKGVCRALQLGSFILSQVSTESFRLDLKLAKVWDCILPVRCGANHLGRPAAPWVGRSDKKISQETKKGSFSHGE